MWQKSNLNQFNVTKYERVHTPSFFLPHKALKNQWGKNPRTMYDFFNAWHN